MQTAPHPALQPALPARPPRGPREFRARSKARGHVADLEARLAITGEQTEAWAAFAETLRANARRMASVDDRAQQPFGALPDRLAALRSMTGAAAQLFAVLEAPQQRMAVELLPLCCLPRGISRA